MTDDWNDPSVLYEEAWRGVYSLLRLMGEDPDSPSLYDTPRRVIAAYMEMTDRPGDPADLLGRIFDAEGYPTDEMIAVGPIEFTSICEHHLLPFTGHAWIAYLPSKKGVVGLSKLSRLLDHYARRPQVQERLTTQVVDALEQHLAPDGSACIIRAVHSCMSLRGVRKTHAEMVTSVLRGAFKDEPQARAEFLALTRQPGSG